LIAALFSEAVKVPSHDSAWSKHEGVDHPKIYHHRHVSKLSNAFNSRGAVISIFLPLGSLIPNLVFVAIEEHQAVMRSLHGPI